MAGTHAEIDHAEFSLGREAGCRLVLQGDAGVSRNHAKILNRGQFIYAVDLGSRNGTLVNGQQIGNTPAQLRSGDIIQICNHVLRFEENFASAQTDMTQAFVPQQHQQVLTTSTWPSNPQSPFAPEPNAPYHPHQQGPMIVNQNMIQVQGKNNLTWLWIFLCLLALGPCGIMCLSLTALAMLPFAMVVGGLTLVIMGFFDYRRFSPYPQWYEQTKKSVIKMVGGGALVVLGALWIGVAWFGPKEEPPLPRPSGNIEFR
jgi:hypothetical protein